MLKHYFTFLLLIILGKTFAQQLILPTEYEAPISKVSTLNSNFHEGVKPYNIQEVNKVINLDSIDYYRTKASPNFRTKAKETKFKYDLNPLLNIQAGFSKELTNNILFGTGIGANLNLNYNNKFHFNSYYQADLNKFPTYIKNYSNDNCVVPQEGIGYSSGNNLHSRNFGGYFNYEASNIFNFEIGHGKNHWGNGYRSLLLSDASNNYSYAKITTTVWKFKYVNLYTNFKDIGNERLEPYWSYNNKFGTFHYLSWNVTKRINFSFFESVIWQAQDTLVNRGFDPNYLNPVIFYRPVEYSIGSSDNSLMGLNVRYKITNNAMYYGQLILDEFYLKEIRTDFLVKAKQLDPSTPHGWWANKQGFQLGLKWNNILLPNLNLQMEYNTVRPYTYSHITGQSNYGHYNQALAHPYGANFKEGIFIINYQKNNWNINLKNIYAIRGLDNDTTNYGGDIYKPYNTIESVYNNYTGQGIEHKMIYTDLKLSYIIKPKTMLHAFVGVRNRYEKLPYRSNNATFIFAGIKTSLYNTYHDF